MNDKVRFIRIKGRIIPIKIDKEKAKRRAQGGFKLGAGFTAAAATSFGSALFKAREISASQAITNAKRAAKEYSYKHGRHHKGLMSIATSLKGRKKLLIKGGTKFNIAGSLIASSLIGAGIVDIVGAEIKKTEHKRKFEIAAQVGSGVLAGGLFIGSRSKFARKIITRSHRKISTKMGWTSKLDREFVLKRKKAQLDIFKYIGKKKI